MKILNKRNPLNLTRWIKYLKLNTEASKALHTILLELKASESLLEDLNQGIEFTRVAKIEDFETFRVEIIDALTWLFHKKNIIINLEEDNFVTIQLIDNRHYNLIQTFKHL